jgi:hypothetical protein
MRFVENNYVPIMNPKINYASEIQLKDREVEEDKQALNANDNLFQLTFKTGEIWNGVA